MQLRLLLTFLVPPAHRDALLEAVIGGDHTITYLRINGFLHTLFNLAQCLAVMLYCEV